MLEVSVPTTQPNRAASVTGLTIAWGGTLLLISPAARGLGDPTHLSMALIGQLLLWLLATTVVVIVLFWEKQTLGSLWLQPFRWRSNRSEANRDGLTLIDRGLGWKAQFRDKGWT